MMWSAVVLGLMGSLHCLAMCGPLVMTLNAKNSQSFSDKLFYNGGRVFTYSVLGLVAGAFGSGIKWAAGQQFLSVFTGMLLLAGLIIGWAGSRWTTGYLSRILANVKIRLVKMLNHQHHGQWWFGVYNGLLPCGLTYVALTAAIAAGSIPESVLYMVLFGIGTSPMMWLIVSGFQRFKGRWLKGNRMVTGFAWFLAILLILRGLGLGVPYLSPDHHHHHHTHKSIVK